MVFFENTLVSKFNCSRCKYFDRSINVLFKVRARQHRWSQVMFWEHSALTTTWRIRPFVSVSDGLQQQKKSTTQPKWQSNMWTNCVQWGFWEFFFCCWISWTFAFILNLFFFSLLVVLYGKWCKKALIWKQLNGHNINCFFLFFSSNIFTSDLHGGLGAFFIDDFDIVWRLVTKKIMFACD